MEKPAIFVILNNERGVSAVLIAILIFFVFIGLAALALDLSHLSVTKNELQNAADAGALAGARFLYNEDGTAINDGSDGGDSANQIAYNAAVANMSEKVPVELLAHGIVYASEGATYPAQQDGDDETTLDVLRGHWSFANKHFTPSTYHDPVPLWGVSDKQLDENPNFINAVQVTVRRTAKPGGTPIAAFFARIFRYDSNGDGKIDSSDNFIENFTQKATAVAYIGFAGTLSPKEVDQPIAICMQSILDQSNNYSCNTGRMINSSGNTETNTGAWTNFTQSPSCSTATPPTVSPLVCKNGNPLPIELGKEMGTINGMTDNVYGDLRDCWLTHTDENGNPDLGQDKDPTGRGYPTKPWGLTLPVIDCGDLGPISGSCSPVVGTVTLNVLWIKQSGTDSHWKDIPVRMELESGQTWDCQTWLDAGSPPDINNLTDDQRHQCWKEFADKFGLETWDNNSVGDLTPSDLQKSIFFLPDCEVHVPKGVSGGKNFGVLARIPVLVK